MPVQVHTITHTLDTVIANFRHWRAPRTQRGRVPPELMEQAAALVGHYPLSKISTSQGLDNESGNIHLVVVILVSHVFWSQIVVQVTQGGSSYPHLTS